MLDELAEAKQAMLDYYKQYAQYHRAYRWQRMYSDWLITELAYSSMINARLAERVITLQAMLDEVMLERHAPG